LSSELSWGGAFPSDESAIATRLLVEAWEQLTSSTSTTFRASLTEPKLTDILCEHLKDISEATGRLTGRWGQENPFGKIDAAAGKRVTSYRTDIEYFSNRSTPTLRLVYEFKKIDGNYPRTLTKYWGADGMGRFIDGDYAIKQPVVLMAGIIVSPKAACVTTLKTTLASKRCEKLSWRNATRTIEPSQSFQEAYFDTEHLRPADKQPSAGYVRICHLFLDFPGTSGAP